MPKSIKCLLIPALFFCLFLFSCGNKKQTTDSNDPLSMLPKEDMVLQRFKDTAQKHMDYLISFMQEHEPNDSLFAYAVKTNFTENGQGEHMWVFVTEFKDGYFTGTLGNDPVLIHNIKFGDPVKVKRETVEDWILNDYLTNTTVGGYSQEYLRDNAR